MAKMIKLNDTLKLTLKQGFPKELELKKHLKQSYLIKDFSKKTFIFKKDLPRIYCLSPTRVFLVQEVKGKWIKWGHCEIIEQTIIKGEKTTGKFRIIKLYEPEYLVLATKNDVPEGKSYF